MEKHTHHSIRNLRQRKFFIVLPLIGVPLVTIFCWSLGLIGTTTLQAQTKESHQRFNMSLPEALAGKDSSWNKLNFYQQADKDSAKRFSLMKSDPYYQLPVTNEQHLYALDSTLPITVKSNVKKIYNIQTTPAIDSYSPTSAHNSDPNEEKVYKKLAELDAQLNQKEPEIPSQPGISQAITTAPGETAEIQRLEKMVQMMQQPESSGDPQMKQISGMLDKILDIQHPGRISDKIKEQSIEHSNQAFPVVRYQEDNFSLLQPKHLCLEHEFTETEDTTMKIAEQNLFYPIGDFDQPETAQKNSIEAVIHETQTVVSGATVKLRLLNDIYVNGALIPMGQLVYGTASLNGERLQISIATIVRENNLLPVALTAYDLDGISGIYMPGAMSRDVAKKSSDQALQGIDIAGFNPSIGAQAASAGIEVAKTLFSKKVKLIAVTVTAGYHVLLKDNNNNNK